MEEIKLEYSHHLTTSGRRNYYRLGASRAARYEESLDEDKLERDLEEYFENNKKLKRIYMLENKGGDFVKVPKHLIKYDPETSDLDIFDELFDLIVETAERWNRKIIYLSE